ncbi:zf-HC2 domain-containing protein [Blastopirellula sp. J2-11]|uniref:zf-HC2 domain-containing protein n=1 Tax=Blastopirellula sp. J2-11 TaxID=2943192 RepID=UPI0021C79C7A|nr:zf-HC2 domain-containing protein [Blastopirellula sp. J2-11]UUO07017.1 zf-HC2 domain-containing protein [Blastopirellula sp. J2-11]
MNAGISEELLSAYLDGQLGPVELQRVEAALAESPALQNQLKSLATARDAVRSLPAATVGRDLTGDIFAEITRRSATTTAAPEVEVELRPMPAGRMSDRHRPRSTRSWQWIGVGAAAAALVAGLLAVPAWLGDNGDIDNNNVANVEPKHEDPAAVPMVENTQDANQPETAVSQPADRVPNFTELMGTGDNRVKPEIPTSPATLPDRKPSGMRIKITSNPPADVLSPDKMATKPMGTGTIARATPNLTEKVDAAFDRFVKPTDFSPESRRHLLSLLATEKTETAKEVTDFEMLAGLRKLPEVLKSTDEDQVELISKLDLDDNNQIDGRELASCLADARFRETETGRQVARLFFRIDDNHDGVWTNEEVTKNVRLAGGLDQEFTRKIRLWDQNHDGVVNFVEAEFGASALQREFQLIEGKLYDSQILAQAQRLFASLDRSGDGSLSGRELTRALDTPEIAAAAAGRKTLSLHELYLHLETIALGL